MIQLLLAIIYLSFISLGLPDGLLGAAWPTMYTEIGMPVSAAGILSMVISLGTIISSLLSDRITYKIGTGLITAISVAMTCVALFGFSFSTSFIMLIIWAVPYGLGAGGVDAALNNYVAVHYTSRHMSWLHCMWGIGAAVGPYFMSYALTGGHGWQSGYRYVGAIQIVLTFILFFSISLWKKRQVICADNMQTEESSGKGSVSKINSSEESCGIENNNGEKTNNEEKNNKGSEPYGRPLGLSEIIKIPGVPAVLLTFFCYCAIESTTGLWAASFLHFIKGIDATKAASMAALFYIGITVGRAINGFLTIKLSDTSLIRIGEGIILLGIVTTTLPLPSAFAFAGIILVGLGCAPIYPCIIHSTPAHFGADKSQSIVGVQMACAYCGTMLMPPVFGILGQNISMILFPVYLLIILILMFFMHEHLVRVTSDTKE